MIAPINSTSIKRRTRCSSTAAPVCQPDRRRDRHGTTERDCHPPTENGRAGCVSDQRIEFVAHPLFDEPDAASLIDQFRSNGDSQPATSVPLSDAGETTATLDLSAALLARPPLSRVAERCLFLRMNFARFSAARLQRATSTSAPDTASVRGTERRAILHESEITARIAALLDEATGIRNRIAEANQRLVVSIAKQFADSLTPLDELIAEAQLPLLRAVELFDVSRGYCFSTYASHTIRNHCRRVRARKLRQLRLVTPCDPRGVAELAADRPANISAESTEAARQTLIDCLFVELVDREKVILSARFGLGKYDRAHTFQEIGRLIGLSKERVRVLAGRAVDKLRQAALAHGLQWSEAC